MKILLAPDSFKGSISSIEFCNIAEAAIKRIDERIEVIKLPMADGGEGTVECIAEAANVRIIQKRVLNPLGKEFEASFCISGDNNTAIIELAKASGLPLIAEKRRNPMITTTFGTGQLIKEALDQGCRKIIVGLGGSATNDGAMGLLSALGIRFLAEKGGDVSFGAKGLLELVQIDTGKMDSRISETEFIGACDVENPLYGESGASYVFGPQKGADPDMIITMDQGLRNYAEVIHRTTGKDIAFSKGAGAAGGAGAGIIAFLNAKLTPGAEIVKEILGFNRILKEEKVDLIITGEGEINYQTAFGKLPCRVAEEAEKYGIPVVALVGKIGEGAVDLHKKGISGIFSIANRPMTLNQAIENSNQLLYDTVYEAVNFYYQIRLLQCREK
ncbi:MAG TPA: glycerate kinase [Clostridia bacterium]|nr:glycerate kinase [Clostridia bacterium]